MLDRTFATKSDAFKVQNKVSAKYKVERNQDRTPKIERILVLSSTTKAATSEACIPRYVRPLSTEGAWKPPPLIAAHFGHPLLLEFPHSADKVLDRIIFEMKVIDVFFFEPRSNLFWLSKAAPQEFLRLVFGPSRALLFKMYRTYTDMQEVLVALIVVDYPAILLVVS